MEQAGVGADALKKMMTAVPDAQTQISSDQLQIQKNKAISDYMTAEKAAVSPAAEGLNKLVQGTPTDPAILGGKASYDIVQQSQELQQRKQELFAEEQRAKGLPPEERAKLETSLSRKQLYVDKLQENLLTNTEKQLGEQYSVLDAIKNEKDFNAASLYMKKQFSTMADAAGLTGNDKDNFVDDHMKKTLPSKWDENTLKQIDVKKNGMLSVQDQIAMKRFDAQTAALNKQTQMLLGREKAAQRAAGAKANSDSVKVLGTALVDIEANIKNNRENSKALDAQIKQLETTMPGKHVFMGFGTNDEYTSQKKQIEDIKGQKKEYDDLISKNEQWRKLYQAKILSLSGTDKMETDDTTPVEPKAEEVDPKLSEAIKTVGWDYEPDKYDYRLGPDGVPQRKKKAD